MDTIMQAVRLVENNQVEKALEKLENFLPLADEEEKYTIAQLYLQWGYLTESSEILHQLLEIYPEETELRIMLAQIYTELEQDEEAIQQLSMIDADDESYVQALVQLADLYQSQGIFEVAEQKLLTAKRIQPDEKVIDFALGELYYSIGEYQHAIVYYERLGQIEFAEVSITERLAESYASAGKYEEALQFYKESDLKTPDALFKYGITAQQAERSDIAIYTWEKVIHLDPYYHTAYYPLAKAYEEEELLDKAYKTAQKRSRYG
ncbi:tetratricopeptide repeat protein [Virgibacillus halophilus]|uniref:Tetratricopeptide repeat protein n=1 Tax=Tigheibacillus halophilus TaxID=361280 RepID=A0ABU5CB79_9BACI|nr:tetratricopeptide repeat protein [Virgibacillus halophilus]